jgi:deoxyribonuclease V
VHVAVDVDYRVDAVVTACVAFNQWTDQTAAIAKVINSEVTAAEYQPGSFFRRELPFLLDALERLELAFSTVVVDGYVWLAEGRPGLGAHLFDALGGGIAVVGVAKNRFRDAPAIEVHRGASKKPLYVTSAGVDPAVAAERIRSMHGAYRIPTLLKYVDQLARG